MSENKTGKYLKYALGEILLVMIGILLALQVNNWNENRKINNDIALLFTALESELENNIKETSSLINYGHMMDSIRTLFRENRVTREMIRNDPRFAYSDYRTRSTFLEEERLDEVIAQEKQPYYLLLSFLKGELKLGDFGKIKHWNYLCSAVKNSLVKRLI
jgi:hypothetical protein